MVARHTLARALRLAQPATSSEIAGPLLLARLQKLQLRRSDAERHWNEPRFHAQSQFVLIQNGEIHPVLGTHVWVLRNSHMCGACADATTLAGKSSVHGLIVAYRNEAQFVNLNSISDEVISQVLVARVRLERMIMRFLIHRPTCWLGSSVTRPPFRRRRLCWPGCT